MKKSFIVFLLFSLIFISSCKKNNEDATKLYLSALEEYSSKNLDQALAILKLAKQAGKSSPQIDFLTAKIYFFQNDYEECSKLLDKILKKNKDFTEARIWKIRCDIVSGNYELAEEELEREISLNMTDWRIFYLYSLLSQKNEKIDEQLIMLNNAEVCLQDAAKVFNSAAMTWGLLGMDEKEKLYLQKAKVLENSNIKSEIENENN